MYTKISEPELTKAQLNAMSVKDRAGRQKNKIDGWVQKAVSGSDSKQTAPNANDVSEDPPNNARFLKRHPSAKHTQDEPQFKKALVSCPICDARLGESSINDHLDKEHAF
jgi:hypothetical protein